jgi:hypothetical protein
MAMEAACATPCGRGAAEAAVSPIAWCARVAEGVVPPCRGGRRCSGALTGAQTSGVAAGCRWLCGLHSAPHSAWMASPVKRSGGAWPGRVPLWSRRWVGENMLSVSAAGVMGPWPLWREGRIKALTISTREAARPRVSRGATPHVLRPAHAASRRPAAPASPSSRSVRWVGVCLAGHGEPTCSWGPASPRTSHACGGTTARRGACLTAACAQGPTIASRWACIGFRVARRAAQRLSAIIVHRRRQAERPPWWGRRCPGGEPPSRASRRT